MKHRRLFFFVLTLALGCCGLLGIADTSASAQPLSVPPTSHATGDPPQACADGVVLDDGTRESGYGWVPGVLDGRYVQEFSANLFPNRFLETVCVCWLRNSLSGNDEDIDFEVVFYRAVSNPDPDDLDCPILPDELPYAVVPATATGVPILGNGQFYEVDVSGVTIPPTIGYVGIRWDASASRFFFLCADQSEGTAPVDGFFRDDQSEGWTSAFKTNDPIFDDYRSLMLRVKGGGVGPAVPALGPMGTLVLAALLGVLGWRRIRRI
jgi:hypothetical protein